jgi:rfaE bifunctional protein nucleotidyltransferase chain/domain
MLSWVDRMVASRQAVANEVRKLQGAGKKVVFTNGCFDILHSGHIDLLRRARALGDALVVGINTDTSVAGMKGPNRPIIMEQERAELLDGMEMVDFVCMFDEATPLETILTIHPDILVKGADWTANIVGQPEVEGWGGKVVALPLVAGHSTTGIVERVLARYRNDGTSRETHS